jgi:hypothetical protein
VSLWLNSRVPATEVARRAGHGVAVLLKMLIHGLYQNNREGIVTRGTPSHSLAVAMTKTSLGTPEAKVVHRRKSGELVEPGRRRLVLPRSD